MHLAKLTNQGAQVTISLDELLLINNALNEVCNGIHISEHEFSTRLGVSRREAAAFLARVHAVIEEVSTGQG